MSKELKKLEKMIDSNIKAAWLQNGRIMLKIRDEGLYKVKYDTFENYLEKRWNYERTRGHRLINSAEFMLKLTAEMLPIGNKKDEVLPQNEAQIRPLIEKLSNDSERVKVWHDVISENKPITAKLVQEKVDVFLASGESAPIIEFILPEKIKVDNTHVSNNSGENEWYTPQKFIECAREVMGSIDLDPASCELANKTVKAHQYITKEENGLESQWLDNVWLNPPYAQPLISQFAEKVALCEFNQAIVLVNNATETKWFQVMAEKSSAICFPSSRIKFIDKNGNPSGAPLQGQAFLYFGDNVESFVNIFSELGIILCNSKIA